MAALDPAVGLVIRHVYLWWSEFRQGREDGSNDRPCVIIHMRQNEYRETEVFIAPITHTPPQEPERAISLPPATKARLGLDDQDSWIITTEVNRFIWPGPDLRPVTGGGWTYGHLPARMTRDVAQQIRDNARDRSLKVFGRDDDALNEKLRQAREPRQRNREDA
jgi:hypothetical protein